MVRAGDPTEQNCWSNFSPHLLWLVVILITYSYCMQLTLSDISLFRVITNYISKTQKELNADPSFRELLKNTSIEINLQRWELFDTFPIQYETQKVDLSMTLQSDTVLLNNQNRANHPFVEADFTTSFFNWHKLTNATSYNYGGVFLDGTAYYFILNEQAINNSGTFIQYECDIAFNFLHKWTSYGHYLIDYFPIVAMVSQKMRKTGCFLVREDTLFVRNAMALFGIPSRNIITLEENETVRAREMYLVSPLVMQTMPGPAIIRMRAIFAKKLGLDKDVPKNFTLHNRRDKRRIRNMEAIYNDLKGVFPAVPFHIYEESFDVTGEWTDRLFFYNSMIFLFAMHGSGSLNAIFMQSHTVMCIINTIESWCSLFPAICKFLYRHGYFMRQGNIPHFAPSCRLYPGKVMPLLYAAVAKAVEELKSWTFREIPLPTVQLLTENGTLILSNNIEN